MDNQKSYKMEEYLPMRINTYICRTLYMKLGKQRNERFILRHSKPKYLYRGFFDCADISSSKINRILKGETKSRYTSEEVDTLSDLFNISKEYFMVGKDKPVLRIPGIGIDMWKIRLNMQYGNQFAYKIPVYTKMDTDIIDKAIGELLKDNCWKELSLDDDLYRILFFYTEGTTFSGSERKEKMENHIKQFEAMTFNDWTVIPLEEIPAHIEKVERQLMFMKSKLIYETAQNQGEI